MGYKGKRIALISGGIVGGLIVSVIFQMAYPFPFGFLYGIVSWPIIASICIVIAFVFIKPKPVCQFCGYIAIDERELHNHQITCEKKK